MGSVANVAAYPTNQPCSACGHPYYEHVSESFDAQLGGTIFVPHMCTEQGCTCQQFQQNTGGN